MNSSTNTGKYILPFAIIILLLNVLLIVFLFLNEKGLFKREPENSETIIESFPVVSNPVSFPK